MCRAVCVCPVMNLVFLFFHQMLIFVKINKRFGGLNGMVINLMVPVVWQVREQHNCHARLVRPELCQQPRSVRVIGQSANGPGRPTCEVDPLLILAHGPKRFDPNQKRDGRVEIRSIPIDPRVDPTAPSSRDSAAPPPPSRGQRSAGRHRGRRRGLQAARDGGARGRRRGLQEAHGGGARGRRAQGPAATRRRPRVQGPAARRAPP